MEDEEFEPQLDPKVQEFLKKTMESLEQAARKIGLYVESAGTGVVPGQDVNLLVVTFTLGEVAFSDRVQNPDKDAAESEFRTMAVQTEEEIFNQLQEDLRKKHQIQEEVRKMISDENDN